MNTEQHIAIRQATVSDLDLLAPIFDAYRQFYRKQPDLALARRFLFDRLQHNESIIFVALQGSDSAVGFTQLFPSFSSGAAAPIFVLNDLYVVPAARRIGVGRALLRAAADFSKRLGAVRLTMSTEVTNESAQALYEAEGWKRQTDYFVYTLSLD